MSGKLVRLQYARVCSLEDEITGLREELASRVDPKAGRRSLVYYMLHGAVVKIGTTTNLPLRLRSVQHDCLVATEFGSYGLERERHRQFAHLHHRGEWFYFEGELAEHCAGLKAAPAVALRAVAGGRVRRVPPSGVAVSRRADPRLLDDVLLVAGDDEKLWSVVLVGRLAVLRPEVYGLLTVHEFAAGLALFGVRTRQLNLRNPGGEGRTNRRGVVVREVWRAMRGIAS